MVELRLLCLGGGSEHEGHGVLQVPTACLSPSSQQTCRLPWAPPGRHGSVCPGLLMPAFQRQEALCFCASKV